MNDAILFYAVNAEVINLVGYLVGSAFVLGSALGFWVMLRKDSVSA